MVDVRTGAIVQKIEGDTEEPTALTVSPDGTTLVVASRSLALRIYSLPECKLIRSIPKSHISQVNLMAIDATSTLLATGGSDGVAKVWDLEGGFATHAFKGHAGVVSALEWNMYEGKVGSSPKKKGKGKDGRTIQLLTGSVDGKVRVWDLNHPSDKPLATLAGHDSVVRGISVTADGSTMVTGSRDRTVVIWRLGPTGTWKQAETLSANEGIEALCFLPSSQHLFYTGGSNGEVRLWDVNSSSIVAKEPRSFNEALASQTRSKRDDEEETRAITSIHLIKDSIVSVHADQNIVIRSLEGLRKERQLIGFNDEIVDLALLSAEEGKESHLAVATNSRALRIYTLGEEEETSAELLAGHTDIVLCLDRSPDGRLLASGAKDRSVRIWSWVPSSRLPSPNAGVEGEVGTRIPRFQPSQSEGDKEGEWVCVASAEGHAESVGALAFARRPASPNSTGAPFLVTASQDRTVKVWDLSPLNNLLSSTTPISTPLTLKSFVTQRVHEKDINCLDISPNNSMLATGSQDRTAKIFSLSFTPPSRSTPASCRLVNIATLKGHKRGIWACKFSPTDLALATASGDKSVRLWSLKTFSTVKLFEGHTNFVLKLNFLSSGMQLASCAADGLIKVWNIKDEENAFTIDAHEDKVWSFVVGRGEGWMISAAADGSMVVWEDRSREEEEERKVEREEEVRLEQEFGNMLTKRDWRNAIGLALRMGQPRRLLGLFTYVQNNRPEVTSSVRGGLLKSALSGDSDDELTLDAGEDSALEHAGIIRKRHGNQRPKQVNGGTASDADASSITGLATVDSIIATLPPPLLIQLLLYIRDWNTSTRTSAIAQTLLHAILSSHSPQYLLSIFSSSAKSHREAIAERLENEELGIVAAKSEKERARERRIEKERNVDLATLIDGLVPYTQRHYDRADRVLIESAMVEYSVLAMDSLLGPDEGDDREGKGMGEEGTFGERLEMEVDSEDEEEEEAMLSDGSASS